MTGPLGLVVERVIPFQFAHELHEALLPAPDDELLERSRNGRLLGRFTAQLERAFDEIGFESEIGGHVCLLTQHTTQQARSAPREWTVADRMQAALGVARE